MSNLAAVLLPAGNRNHRREDQVRYCQAVQSSVRWQGHTTLMDIKRCKGPMLAALFNGEYVQTIRPLMETFAVWEIFLSMDREYGITGPGPSPWQAVTADPVGMSSSISADLTERVYR